MGEDVAKEKDGPELEVLGRAEVEGAAEAGGELAVVGIGLTNFSRKPKGGRT